MKDVVHINVSKDFSRFPAGRFRSDGQFSGEVFREKHLIAALAAAKKAIIDLDGTAGYGSSFLEEAFGGLVRSGQGSAADIRARIELKSADKSLIAEIEEYIDQAVK